MAKPKKHAKPPPKIQSVSILGYVAVFKSAVHPDWEICPAYRREGLNLGGLTEKEAAKIARHFIAEWPNRTVRVGQLILEE